MVVELVCKKCGEVVKLTWDSKYVIEHRVSKHGVPSMDAERMNFGQDFTARLDRDLLK